MDFLLCSLLVVSLSFYLFFLLSSSSPDLFTSWCHQHGKSYSSEEERLYRLKVFTENLGFVVKHNMAAANNEYSYTLSMNAFADLTYHEFKSSRLGLSAGSINLTERNQAALKFDDAGHGVVALPSSVDWRNNGAVTPVKDQANCGACWSFSATGAIEGINKIATGSLVSLSEQELVDCDKSSNNGCGGGLMDYAFQFVIDNHGIDTEDDYRYQAKENTCDKNKLKRHVVTIDGFIDVPTSSETQLLKAVAAQPVSVGICGSERAFQLYSKGIFNGPCSTSLDHAVLVVGYGSENGVDYWIVKNSWGTRWGMDGYIYMKRNTGNPQGVCGINMLASYPTKTSPNPPPPPSPGPNKCDLFTSCGQGETCCCMWRMFGICFSWQCCELDSSVCCKDNHHCCPRDYPICDTKRNQCLKHTENYTLVKKLEKGGSLDKFGAWRSFFEAWNL